MPMLTTPRKASLPSHFDTPMFWTGEELDELRGTSVVGIQLPLSCSTRPLKAKPLGKIGKSEAEADYHTKVVPAIRSRPDLFPPDNFDRWYTLERYHIMGSRILSRSFQVEQRGTSPSNEEDDCAPQAEMDVDGGAQNSAEPDAEHSDEVEESHYDDPDDEDHQESGDVAMVPMADMLNARFGCNNVRSSVRVAKHI